MHFRDSQRLPGLFVSLTRPRSFCRLVQLASPWNEIVAFRSRRCLYSQTRNRNKRKNGVLANYLSLYSFVASYLARPDVCVYSWSAVCVCVCVCIVYGLSCHVIFNFLVTISWEGERHRLSGFPWCNPQRIQRQIDFSARKTKKERESTKKNVRVSTNDSEILKILPSWVGGEAFVFQSRTS